MLERAQKAVAEMDKEAARALWRELDGLDEKASIACIPTARVLIAALPSWKLGPVPEYPSQEQGLGVKYLARINPYLKELKDCLECGRATAHEQCATGDEGCLHCAVCRSTEGPA